MNTPAWQTFSLPDFALRFHYPTTTSDGHLVEMDDVRVHFRAKANAEFYFEITRRLHISPQEAYAHEKSFMETQLAESTVSALQAITFAAHPAFEFSVTWRDGERTVVLIQKGEALYRVLYDSRLPLNLQALATIEILA